MCRDDRRERRIRMFNSGLGGAYWWAYDEAEQANKQGRKKEMVLCLPERRLDKLDTAAVQARRLC